MKPDERRWKWVRQDCLPEDMKKVLGIGQKIKKEKEAKKEAEGPVEGEVVEEEFKETKVAISNYHELDYTDPANVYETMKKLKEERRSTKYKQNYHILVLSKIVDEFKPISLNDIRHKVNAYLLLIGTTF